MNLRPLEPKDAAGVRALYTECHPGWPARPRGWFTAYPTLVAIEDAELVGFTSFSIGNYTGLVMLTGQDLCVQPAARGTGVGLALHLERCAFGAGVGARMFSGITQPENKAMVRIFERCGYHACQPAPGYFWGEDGVVYLGAL